MVRKVSAALSCGELCTAIAISWYSVLSCMNWMPVWAKISALDTRWNAASIIPSVRASR